MRPEVLQACLLKRHREAGFYLDEPDDHTLLLRRKGHPGDLAAWSASGATIKEIQETCDHYMTGKLRSLHERRPMEKQQASAKDIRIPCRIELEPEEAMRAEAREAGTEAGAYILIIKPEDLARALQVFPEEEERR